MCFVQVKPGRLREGVGLPAVVGPHGDIALVRVLHLVSRRCWVPARTLANPIARYVLKYPFVLLGPPKYPGARYAPGVVAMRTARGGAEGWSGADPVHANPLNIGMEGGNHVSISGREGG